MTSLVTDVGLAAIVSAMVAANTMKHLGWGSGSGQDETATDLAVALPESRTSGTLTALDDTYRVTGTIVATSTRAVTEVGVFSAAAGAVLGVYGDFAAIALSVGDTIAFTIDVVFDQA